MISRGPVAGWGGRNRAQATVAAVAAAMALLALGCPSSREASKPRFPSTGEGGTSAPAPVPPADATFGYHASNDGCSCREYAASDARYPVRYRFSATYRMDAGFRTRVKITFGNDSRDTLFLDPGTVTVSSRNISYQYNNRSLPLPALVIPPGDSEEVNMEGSEVTDAPTWNRIAGEQLSVTIRGMRLGEKVLAAQEVRFVPENPMLNEGD